MALTDIDSAVSSDLTPEYASGTENFYSVPTSQTDGPTESKETFYINFNWSQQLGFYKKIPEFVGIYALESGFIGGYKPTREMLTEIEDEIKQAAKDIRKNLKEDSFPANPKYFGRVPACNYCAYNSICPFSLAKN